MPYFPLSADCMGKVIIPPLIKRTSAIRQMAYGFDLDALDEYMQIGAITAHESLVALCTAVIESIHFIGSDYLPRLMDLACVLLCLRDEQRHERFTVIPYFNDLKSGKAPDVPFVANDVTYKREYYLTDGIYPEWLPYKLQVAMKAITELAGSCGRRHTCCRLLQRLPHGLKAAAKDAIKFAGFYKGSEEGPSTGPSIGPAMGLRGERRTNAYASSFRRVRHHPLYKCKYGAIGRYGVSAREIHKKPRRFEDQYAVSMKTHTPYSLAVHERFWKISIVVPTPRKP
ncbi:WAT1-related protein isoform X1 [Tanacetum coccineum]